MEKYRKMEEKENREPVQNTGKNGGRNNNRPVKRYNSPVEER